MSATSDTDQARVTDRQAPYGAQPDNTPVGPPSTGGGGGVPVGPVTTSGLTMTTARLLGRTTAGTGAIEEITVGAGLSLAAGALTSTATGTVTSVSGTANEITSSGGTTPVISLPTALTFTGKTVTGGTFVSGAFNGTLGATTPRTIACTTFSSQISTGTNPVLIGVCSDNNTYGQITFNNVSALATSLGIIGGGGTDTNLYVNVPVTGTIRMLVNNALAGRFQSTGLTDCVIGASGAANGTFLVMGATSLATSSFVTSGGVLSCAIPSLSNGIQLAAVTGATTYGLLTFNNNLTGGGSMGLQGGGGADTNLYINVPATGAIKGSVNAANMFIATVASFALASGTDLKLGRARSAGVAVQGGTITILDSAGTTVTLLTT